MRKLPQSVLDALADAETLCAVAREIAGYDEPDAMLSALYAASQHGRYIRRARYPKSAAHAGVLAARAAFRAVPGLREP